VAAVSSRGSSPRAAGGDLALSDLVVPAHSAALPLVKRWVQEACEVALVHGRVVSRLEDAVLEACLNAVNAKGSGSGESSGKETEEISLSAWLDDGRLRIEVQEPCDYGLALARDCPRRHRGLGLPRMVSLVDELAVKKVTPGRTLVSLSVRRGGGCSSS
jgi:anti-sigma regulatory factor (Ser/Thr protein kinase)